MPVEINDDHEYETEALGSKSSMDDHMTRCKSPFKVLGLAAVGRVPHQLILALTGSTQLTRSRLIAGDRAQQEWDEPPLQRNSGEDSGTWSGTGELWSAQILAIVCARLELIAVRAN